MKPSKPRIILIYTVTIEVPLYEADTENAKYYEHSVLNVVMSQTAYFLSSSYAIVAKYLHIFQLS